MVRPLRIAVATGTRAEYGILRPLLQRLAVEPAFDVSVVVTGMHLSSRFGDTVSEVEADAYRVSARIPLDLDDDTETGVARATAQALIGFSEAFEAERPELLLVLGDRTEILAAAIAALLASVPVAHLHGGELTRGAVDDAIRHSVTKMSWLHFTATEGYRQRVIQLGEDPSRVFATGALGVDNALSLPLLSADALEAEIGSVFGARTVVVTYHPVTLEPGSAAEHMAALTQALEWHEDLSVVFTAPNADQGNRVVFEAIERFVEHNRDRATFFVSLGARRYLSLIAAADACIGNSSSGIIEAPSLGTPTVDIGDRQDGRERGPSVTHCDFSASAIFDAIAWALSPEAKAVAERHENPYGDGHAAERIVAVLTDFASTGGVPGLKKTFFDVPEGVKQS